MADQTNQPQLREHLREIRKALGGIGRDVKVEIEDAPHTVREGTKNTLAKAAGVRRNSMKEWTAPSGESSGESGGSR